MMTTIVGLVMIHSSRHNDLQACKPCLLGPKTNPFFSWTFFYEPCSFQASIGLDQNYFYSYPINSDTSVRWKLIIAHVLPCFEMANDLMFVLLRVQGRCCQQIMCQLGSFCLGVSILQLTSSISQSRPSYKFDIASSLTFLFHCISYSQISPLFSCPNLPTLWYQKDCCI